METEFYFSGKDNPTMLLSIKGGGMFQMLLMQLAANMIQFTEEHDPSRYAEIQNKDFNGEESYWKGDMLQLRKYANGNWAIHGYLNAVVQQVSFLYSSIKALLELPDGYAKNSVLNWTSIPIFVQALAQFQRWKTTEIKKSQEYNGPEWGTATGWNKQDWSDLNEKMQALLPPLPLDLQKILSGR